MGCSVEQRGCDICVGLSVASLLVGAPTRTLGPLAAAAGMRGPLLAPLPAPLGSTLRALRAWSRTSDVANLPFGLAGEVGGARAAGSAEAPVAIQQRSAALAAQLETPYGDHLRLLEAAAASRGPLSPAEQGIVDDVLEYAGARMPRPPCGS